MDPAWCEALITGLHEAGVMVDGDAGGVAVSPELSKRHETLLQELADKNGYNFNS